MVPDKFFALNSAFRILRTQLTKLGIIDIQDIQGCLSGTFQVELLRQICFFSASFSKFLLQQYGLSPAAPDGKLVATIFRLVPFDLRPDQFMTIGGFVIKKIEFLTLVVKEVLKLVDPKTDHPPGKKESLKDILQNLSNSISLLNNRISDSFDSLNIRIASIETLLDISAQN